MRYFLEIVLVVFLMATFVGAQRQDSICTMDTGKTGVCRPFANCQTAKVDAYKGILPQICDLDAQTVCCPPSTIVEGSVCTVEGTTMTGVYKPFANCQTAMKAASEGTFPQPCGLSGIHTIVCCLHSNATDENMSSSSSRRIKKPKEIRPVPLSGTIGDSCEIENGLPGKCKLLGGCPSAMEAMLRGMRSGKIFHPKTCFMMGIVPIICCGV